MKALLYVSVKSWNNHVRKALKKPATYFVLCISALYIVMFGSMLYGWRTTKVFTSPEVLATILTILSVLLFFSNFVTYAKKRGILFKPSHSHLIFPAPISPKVILIMGAIKNFTLNTIFGGILFFIELYVFRLPLYQAILITAGMTVFETILEASLIIFLYANETLSEKTTTLLCRSIYLFLGAIVVASILYFRKNGIALDTVIQFVNHPVVELIPVVGWNVAFYRLLLIGGSKVTLLCSLLYFLTVAVFFLIAKKMPCQGAYYEDAAKFADDYVKFYQRNKRGEVAFTIGKEKTYKKVKEHSFHGVGAKAIFYRQLLEYRKERFFILNGTSLLALSFAALGFFIFKEIGDVVPKNLLLLIVLAYVVFCTSVSSGKWEKELNTPYLYLLPDTAWKKLWYSTVMEHIRSTLEAVLICVPLGVLWNISVVDLLISICLYVLLQANKLYIRVLSESLIGNLLGTKGKQFVGMLLQSVVLLVGMLMVIVLSVFRMLPVVLPALVVYEVVVVGMVMMLASIRFEKMEQVNEL